MDTKIKCIITFIGLNVIIFFNGCGKLCSDGAKTVFNFKIDAKAYPNKDSIQIGDTIWLEIIAPTSLIDISSKKPVDYSGAVNLGSAIGFLKLNSDDTFTIKAVDKFDYLLKHGVETRNADKFLFREYLFIEMDNKYLFTLGVIPKEKGIYGIIFSNAANVSRKNDKCTKSSFEINFDNTDQHRYLNPNFNGEIVKGGDYYFKVY